MVSSQEGSDAPVSQGPGDPLDASSDAAAVVSGEGLVTAWTRGAEALLGHPAAEMVGSSAARLLALPRDPSRVAAVAERCRGGMGWSGHIPLRHRDGRRIDADLRVSASFRMGGSECFLISARDRRRPWTVGPAFLDGFLTRSPVGMAVLDLQLRYVWMNDTLEHLGGVPRGQRLGRRLTELLPGLQAETIEGLMRKVLATGEPMIDYEYLGWSWADPHRRHAYSTSFFPLVGVDKSYTGVCYTVLDVTDRWNARQILSLVNEAGTTIGGTLDVMRTAQEIADFAVPRFADFVIVDLLESVLSTEGHGAWLSDAGPAPAKPMMRRAGMSSVREGCPEAVARIGDRADFLPPPHDVHLLTDSEPVLIQVLDPDDDLWIAEEPERAASIRRYGLHSLISVPMRARNTALGLTTFIRSLNPVSFQPDDVLLAREVVARAALCVDNARRYTREHTAAVTLQRSLLPHALSGGQPSRWPPPICRRTRAAASAATGSTSSRCPGPGSAWSSATWSATASPRRPPWDGCAPRCRPSPTWNCPRRTAGAPRRPRAPAQRGARPGTAGRPDHHRTGRGPEHHRVLPRSDLPLRRLRSRHQALHDGPGRTSTPVFVAPDGRVSYPELPAGPPLGLGGMAFESREIELEENSLIGLFTDGLVAGAHYDMELGMAQLGELLARPDPDLEALCSDAVRHLVPVPQPDDIALLLARTHSLGDDHVVSWEVPVDPAAVSEMRARATRVIEAWGLGELTMTTELIVSELVTNAIRYAVPPIRLRMLCDTRLTCEVSDASSTAPRLRHARSTDEGGRGLFLVAQLSHRWGARYTADGKIIWAEQEIP